MCFTDPGSIFLWFQVELGVKCSKMDQKSKNDEVPLISRIFQQTAPISPIVFVFSSRYFSHLPSSDPNSRRVVARQLLSCCRLLW